VHAGGAAAGAAPLGDGFRLGRSLTWAPAISSYLVPILIILHALSRVWNTRVFLGSYRQAVKYCTVVCREVR
jgi:hypothetical protein